MNLRSAAGRMRSNGVAGYVAGAALSALLAGALFVVAWRQVFNSRTVTAYVAAQNLAPGTILSASDLKAMTIPDTVVPDAAIRQLDQAVGKRLRLQLLAGDPVQSGYLLTDGESDLAQRLAALGAEFRALTLPVEVVPATEHLIPGDHIELTGVIPLQNKDANTQVATLLSRATVMEILLDQDKKPVGVMVAVVAQDIPKVALALKAGSVTVAAMPPSGGDTKVSPLRLDTLAGSTPTDDQTSLDPKSR